MLTKAYVKAHEVEMLRRGMIKEPFTELCKGGFTIPCYRYVKNEAEAKRRLEQQENEAGYGNF